MAVGVWRGMGGDESAATSNEVDAGIRACGSGMEQTPTRGPVVALTENDGWGLNGSAAEGIGRER